MVALLYFLCISVFTLTVQGDINNEYTSGKQPKLLSTDDILFDLYVKAFNKTYHEKEYEMRRHYFFKNLKQMLELQKKDKNVKYAVNHLTDYTEEEYKAIRGFKMPIGANVTKVKYIPKGQAPEEWDWRDHNAVTGVKNQGDCNSCYVFSAIGNIEGQYAIKHGQLVSLSEQQALDCDSGTQSCQQGGYPVKVMQLLAEAGGSQSEESYPYTGTMGACDQDMSKVVAKVTGGQQLTLDDEEALKNALYNTGPLSIALAVGKQLHLYRGGVINPTDCSAMTINHALVLVGYGTDSATNRPYWLIKNSWDVTWGEQGYLRLARGQGACGILEMVSAATVA